MARIVRALKIGQVTRGAKRISRRQRVVVVHMAGTAGHVDVRARQREAGRRVIEIGSRPRCCGVAGFACGRERGLHVVRVVRTLEVRQVARRAQCVRSGQRIVIVHVTGNARHCDVRSVQRESRCGVIEDRSIPRSRRRVTDLAVRRKVCLQMVRTGRALKVRHVTG